MNGDDDVYYDYDPQLAELRSMGLNDTWVAAAQVIGVANFVRLWEMLDSSTAAVEHNGQLRVTLPRYSRYNRHQRNLVITTLAASGHSVPQIQRTLSADYGVKVSESTIRNQIR